jgi:DNA-binding transcriptional LysR family regulator
MTHSEGSAVDQEYWSLRVFCTVAEQQSVSGAARQLMMSQSGVSNVIHRLGQRYGHRLIETRGKRVLLTSAGVELYRHALNTLRSAYDLETRLRAINGQSGGLVTFATRSSLSSHFLPPVLEQFCRAHPGVELRVIDVATWSVVLRDVLIAGSEFAVLQRSAGLVVDSGLVVEPFHREDYILVVGPDHPLAQQDAPSITEIAQAPFIVNSPRSGQITRLEEVFRSAGAGGIHIVIEMDGDGAKQLVRAGVGLALMLRCRVQEELDQGALKALPLPHPMAGEFALIYERNHQLSRPAADLVDALRAYGNLGSHPRESALSESLNGAG